MITEKTSCKYHGVHWLHFPGTYVVSNINHGIYHTGSYTYLVGGHPLRSFVVPVAIRTSATRRMWGTKLAILGATVDDGLPSER